MKQHFLTIYSGVLTLVFAVTVLCGFTSKPAKMEVDQLDVHRINLREPDGTLRMVISDKAEFPGFIIHGKEYPHPRPVAGMIFFNDEGTENGGLIFSGYKDKNGNIVGSGGSLTFDQYENDQVVQILGEHDGDEQQAGVIVNDRPNRPITQDVLEMQAIEAMPEAKRHALMEQRMKTGYYGSNRIRVTRDKSDDAEVALCDQLGRPRLTMLVTPGGEASLQFLDENGKVLSQITPSTAASAKPSRH